MTVCDKRAVIKKSIGSSVAGFIYSSLKSVKIILSSKICSQGFLIWDFQNLLRKNENGIKRSMLTDELHT